MRGYAQHDLGVGKRVDKYIAMLYCQDGVQIKDVIPSFN